MGKHTWTIAAMTLFLSFIVGCSITGNTAGVLENEIIGCSLNTDIEFLMINDQVQACYRSNSLYFVVDNTGTGQISGLSVYLESDYNITMHVRAAIDPGDISQHSLNFGSQELTGVKRLRVRPVISANRVGCTDSAIEVEISHC